MHYLFEQFSRSSRLRQMDVEFMKRLHRKVNIVPVIAKADTLTKPEINKLKINILNDIDTNKIKVGVVFLLCCGIIKKVKN